MAAQQKNGCFFFYFNVVCCWLMMYCLPFTQLNWLERDKKSKQNIYQFLRLPSTRQEIFRRLNFRSRTTTPPSDNNKTPTHSKDCFHFTGCEVCKRILGIIESSTHSHNVIHEHHRYLFLAGMVEWMDW